MSYSFCSHYYNKCGHTDSEHQKMAELIYCTCGHSLALHYPYHTFMNGCMKETCECLEFELRVKKSS